MTQQKQVTLPDLGVGGAFALWGFRAAAIGHADCPALQSGFDRSFGEDAAPALHAICRLVKSLGMDGRRRILLSRPGCCAVTHDEMSIVAMLSAAQTGDGVRREAHLCWLMGKGCNFEAAAVATRIGEYFRGAGMVIDAPAIAIETPAPARWNVTHHVVGNA